MSDLSFLDSLLEESMALATAKSAKGSGRKLTQEQAELLEANAAAEDMELWEPEGVYAVIANTRCVCGNCFKDFRGWFRHDTQRKGRGQRLTRVENHDGLPAAVYEYDSEVDWCSECAPDGLANVTADWCPLLLELGEQASPEQHQLELFQEL